MRQTDVPASRVELNIHQDRSRPLAQPGFGGQKAADALEDDQDHDHLGGLRGAEQAPSPWAARRRVERVPQGAAPQYSEPMVDTYLPWVSPSRSLIALPKTFVIMNIT